MNTSLTRTLVLGALIAALYVFAGALLAPIEVRFIERFTVDTSVTGFIYGAASLILALSSYYIGRVSDSFGRRRTLLFGALTGIVFSLLYANVFNVLTILGAKFVWAVAVAATAPVMAAYLQSLLSDNGTKGKLFGYVYSIESLAGSAGALLGAYVFEQYSLALVMGCSIVAYGVAFMLTLLLPDIHEKKRSQDGEPILTKRSLVKTVAYIFSRPALRFYFVVNFSVGLNWGLKSFLWPLIIFSIAGSDLISGAIFATMGVIAFFFLPIAGMLSDRLQPVNVMYIELVIFGITGIILAMTDNTTLFWITAGIYTIAEALNGPAQATLLTEHVDESIRGEVMGFDHTVDHMLRVTGPLVAGFLVSLWSASVALLCFVALYWIALLVGYTIMRNAATSQMDSGM